MFTSVATSLPPHPTLTEREVKKKQNNKDSNRCGEMKYEKKTQLEDYYRAKEIKTRNNDII